MLTCSRAVCGWTCLLSPAFTIKAQLNQDPKPMSVEGDWIWLTLFCFAVVCILLLTSARQTNATHGFIMIHQLGQNCSSPRTWLNGTYSDFLSWLTFCPSFTHTQSHTDGRGALQPLVGVTQWSSGKQALYLHSVSHQFPCIYYFLIFLCFSYCKTHVF